MGNHTYMVNHTFKVIKHINNEELIIATAKTGQLAWKRTAKITGVPADDLYNLRGCICLKEVQVLNHGVCFQTYVIP